MQGGKKAGEGRIPLPMSATPIVILEIDVAMGDTKSITCKAVEKTNPWSRAVAQPELKRTRRVNLWLGRAKPF